MWVPALGFRPYPFPPQRKCSKLITIYALVLLISLGFTAGHGRSFNHQIGNRSPEIDPFWYVGRGVRPIGRFGKRHLKSGWNSLRSGSSSLDLILKALQEQEALAMLDDAGL
ncbi:hypothetical protein lerEdw1_012781 [Lerista edwardsae]|nr:hypothetical protein lerEdw1_012781 [Lerista edwardsae]